MKLRLSYYRATLLQLAIPLLLLWGLRFPFVCYNISALGNPSAETIFRLSFYGFQFDICAWAWFNALFILLRFLPFNFTQRKGYLRATDIIYLLTNTLLLLPAMADIPFFQFNGSHLRWQTLLTIWTDPEIISIIFSFFKDYWWVFISGFVILGILFWAVFGIHILPLKSTRIPTLRVRLYQVGIFTTVVVLTFICIRGHLGPGRPLSIGDAVWVTSQASHRNIVLNAPFCIIRSLHRDYRVEEMNFFNKNKLASIRSSLHHPIDSMTLLKKNIFIIAIESGSSIWMKNLNPVKNDTLPSLMPFLDSLSQKSVAFPNAYTTGIRSIEGITAVFGGVPTFDEMVLMTSPYFTNSFDTPANLLKKEGYATRFYFGGNHGSFNIDQTLKIFGFDEIISREEYGNEKDYDGGWGIWDHKMGEYAARDITTLPQPFIAGWFTLNPHGPFDVPDDWETEGYVSTDPMKKTVEYEDRAIRHFFDVAKMQPWYDNTIFVIVADHGCRDLKETIYDSSFILPHITLMIFSPDGSLPPQRIENIAVSQLDIASTLIDLAGYPRDYISLGHNMLSPSHPGYAIMFIHGAFQICSAQYAVRLSADMKRIEGVYDIRSDFEMKRPLSRFDGKEVNRMVEWGRAFLQDYSERINNDRLSFNS